MRKGDQLDPIAAEKYKLLIADWKCQNEVMEKSKSVKANLTKEHNYSNIVRTRFRPKRDENKTAEFVELQAKLNNAQIERGILQSKIDDNKNKGKEF